MDANENRQLRVLNAEDRLLLERVAVAVRSVEPTARIILYGSRARGDARDDSDWDLLILVDEPVTPERTAKVRDRIYEVEWTSDAVLSAIVRSAPDWSSPTYRMMPFHRNVEREGIEVCPRAA